MKMLISISTNHINDLIEREDLGIVDKFGDYLAKVCECTYKHSDNQLETL